eukprot:68249-Rhodomonas_salina.2
MVCSTWSAVSSLFTVGRNATCAETQHSTAHHNSAQHKLISSHRMCARRRNDGTAARTPEKKDERKDAGRKEGRGRKKKQREKVSRPP